VNKKSKVPLTEEEVYERYKDNPYIAHQIPEKGVKGVYWDRWHHEMPEEERMEYRKEILKRSLEEVENNEVLRNFYYYDRWYLNENYKRKFRKLSKLNEEYDIIWTLYDKTNFEDKKLYEELQKLKPTLFNEYKRVIRKMLREWKKEKGEGG